LSRWSLGVILYILLSGIQPFEAVRKQKLLGLDPRETGIFQRAHASQSFMIVYEILLPHHA
jgi:hypothetical protein